MPSPLCLQEKGKGATGRGATKGKAPVKPSGEQVQYKKNKMHARCCFHAFSANKEFKYAFYNRCVQRRAEGASEPAQKRGRGARGDGKVQKGDTSNDKDCSGEHRLRLLSDMTDRSYLRKHEVWATLSGWL